jgi:hypothetical protein
MWMNAECTDKSEINNFARAIERAHGIGSDV